MGRIRVSLLTGFLGAGKTTLLNHWVKQPDMSGVAVLVNEFGDVGIDHHLVDKTSDQMLLLDSGCLCCAVQGDLVRALRTLATRTARREIPDISRVVIETTGLADPVPVLFTLMEDPFVRARFVCDAVVTAVSAVSGLRQLGSFAEARRQVAAADRLIITKSDLASTAVLAALVERLRVLNPQAQQVTVRDGIADTALLRHAGVYGQGQELRRIELGAWLGSTEQESAQPPEGRTLGAAARGRARGGSGVHTPRVRSFSVTFDEPLPWLGFSVVMGGILRQHGARLLRTKGIIRLAGDAQPRVVQCVEDIAYPPLRLAQWPGDGLFADGRGRLVFITHDLDAGQTAAITRAFDHMPGDAAALRLSAADLSLPTRCWLAHRAPPSPSASLHHDGWVIQQRRFRGG